MESLHVYTTPIGDSWYCRKSSAQSKGRHLCRIAAIGSKWKLVGRFHGMSHLSAKRHRSIVWWEDAYERRFGQPFKGPIIPFGSLVEYYPITAKDQSRIHQFGKKVLPGLFLGYALYARLDGETPSTLEMLANARDAGVQWAHKLDTSISTWHSLNMSSVAKKREENRRESWDCFGRDQDRNGDRIQCGAFLVWFHFKGSWSLSLSSVPSFFDWGHIQRMPRWNAHVGSMQHQGLVVFNWDFSFLICNFFNSIASILFFVFFTKSFEIVAISLTWYVFHNFVRASGFIQFLSQTAFPHSSHKPQCISDLPTMCGQFFRNDNERPLRGHTIACFSATTKKNWCVKKGNLAEVLDIDVEFTRWTSNCQDEDDIEHGKTVFVLLSTSWATVFQWRKVCKRWRRRSGKNWWVGGVNGPFVGQ